MTIIKYLLIKFKPEPKTNSNNHNVQAVDSRISVVDIISGSFRPVRFILYYLFKFV